MNSYKSLIAVCFHVPRVTYGVMLCSVKTRPGCPAISGVAFVNTRIYATLPRREAPNFDRENKTPLKAIDLANKMQRKKEQDVKAKQQVPNKPPLTPQQKRIEELRRFTQQLQKVHPNVLAKHLHRSVIFQNEDFVAVNKPFGVLVNDGSGGANVSAVLPILSKMMNGMKAGADLYPCLGLDKEITGAMLLARSEELAEHVKNLLKNHEVKRKYWVITVGVPVPAEGVIDIPVIERETTGSQPHFKMGLSPVYRMKEGGEGLTRVRAHRQAQGAVTQYRVVDSSHGCSLVELHPITVVKHQMRVHAAYALGCPILGDHKYAHWSKLAPQRLPEGVLKRLGLEQSKARHLPLHLHSHQLVLPEVKGHGDLTIFCSLPKFFIESLRRLQLSLPQKPD